ncbi:calcium-activated chloride channel regulator 4A [Dermacentor silvarum]|uniref:calcium-activated chloride channel regulator 4A n=1 Tax=Dermacentor silvarum TaxID=543639 RepID=UPI0021008A16|nr:calcium-activated chloride channel regulator 4A [Dermacentor silvarum]
MRCFFEGGFKYTTNPGGNLYPPGGCLGLEAQLVLVRDNRSCMACDHYRSIRSLLLAWLLLQCWGSDGRVNAAIQLQDDGGYVDIVVAVHEALPVESQLVEQLKSVLSRSSAFLHRATRGLVYFREVTIALPPHWPPAEHGDALASLHANAPIRIVTSEQAQWPRTVQPRPCGEAGEYTLLPVAALRDPQADYLVVHEWAHLRYGVFDEFGSPKDPLYPAVYIREGQARRHTCLRLARDDEQHGWTLKACDVNKRDEATSHVSKISVPECLEDDVMSLRKSSTR